MVFESYALYKYETLLTTDRPRTLYYNYRVKPEKGDTEILSGKLEEKEPDPLELCMEMCRRLDI